MARITRSCPLYRSAAASRATVSNTVFPVSPYRDSSRAGFGPGRKRSSTVLGRTLTVSGAFRAQERKRRLVWRLTAVTRVAPSTARWTMRPGQDHASIP